MNENIDVEELVLRIQSGDDEAFSMMVKQYERLVYFIAMKSLRNPADAKDVMQETFIEVRKSIKNLKEPKLFKAWLNRVVFSKISRFYSKNKELSLDDSTYSQLHRLCEKRTYLIPDKAMNYRNNRELLDHCILQLKPIYREVILLRYFEQMSLLEIADTLSIPEGTVKSRINVAKKELRNKVLALENKEQIHLDFESQTLEAMLVSYFIDAYACMKVPKYSGILFGKQFFKNQFMSTPAMSLVICGTIALGGACLGTVVFNQLHSSATPHERNTIYQPVKDIQSNAFPRTQVGSIQIDTAKNAYTVLYDEFVSRKNSDIEKQKEIEVLYKTLQNYGGHYAAMAEYLKEMYK